jgi:nucleotide-binding universal stress UspA family protein
MDAKKIVVGVDGSPGSDAALAWAIDEAAALGAEIIAIHVLAPIRPPAPAAIGNYVPLAQFQISGFDVIPRIPEPSLAPLKLSGIEHRILNVHGRPATEILRAADQEDAGLIVVGNGLPSTMAEIFLGSVAHELTHHARRPLVIVPIQAAAVGVDALGTKQVAQEEVARVVGAEP